MKQLPFVLLMMSLLCCTEDNSACLTSPEPFKGTLLDSERHSLLDSNSDVELYYRSDDVRTDIAFEIIVAHDNVYGLMSSNLSQVSADEGVKQFYLQVDDIVDTIVLNLERKREEECVNFSYRDVRFNSEEAVIDKSSGFYTLQRKEQEIPECMSHPKVFRGLLVNQEDNNVFASNRHVEDVDLYYMSGSARVNVPFEIAEVQREVMGIVSPDLPWVSVDEGVKQFYLQVDDTVDTLLVDVTTTVSDNCEYFAYQEVRFNGEIAQLDSLTEVYTLQRQ